MKLEPKDYRNRVLGCWMGKNIGGTLGAPFEFWRQVNDVSFYTQDLGGEPLPNDDLDLQLLWLVAMEEQGIDVDANVLAEYWCTYIVPHWSEYGIAKTNMRAGLVPPFCGTWANEWRHSCGAFIRSEIWACIAPGLPEVAVRYAVEDAVVDHGDGEGTWGEVFFAALESAAFVCDDIRALIDIGLSYIPPECGMARAVRTAVAAHDKGIPWREARDEILKHHRGSTLFMIPERTSPEDHEKGFDTGRLGYDAPSNVAMTVYALLHGGDDFAKVVCTAVNCGEDTDCTGATAGALFGIMHGIEAIPQKWIEPIGRGIKTVSLNLGELGHFGAQVPQDVDDLTDRTERVMRRVVDRAGQVANRPDLPRKDDEDDDALKALFATEAVTSDLAARIVSARYRFGFFSVDVEPKGGPAIRSGEAKRLTLTIHNHYKTQANIAIRWHVPEGWSVDPSPTGSVMSLPGIMGGRISVPFTLRAGEITGSVARCMVELTIDGRPTVMPVPVVLANGNLSVR